MTPRQKQMADELLKLSQQQRDAAKSGNAQAVKKMAGVKEKIRQAATVPTPVFSSHKEVLQKCEVLGTSPLLMNPLRKSAEDLTVVDQEVKDFHDYADTLRFALAIGQNRLDREAGGSEYAPRMTPNLLKSRTVLFRDYMLENEARFASFIEVEKTRMAKTSALYTGGTSSGLEWIPEIWSPTLVDVPHLPFKLVAVFKIVTMTSKKQDIPTWSGDIHFLKGSEITDDDPSKVGAVVTTTGKAQLEAQKFEARLSLSTEETEDAVFDAVVEGKNKLRSAYAMDVEDTVINGDATDVNHFDADVTAATDRRKIFDGLRYYEANNQARTDMSGVNFTYDNLIGLRNKLPQNFRDKESLIYCTSGVGGAKVGGLDEFVSLEKYGPKAHVLTGEIGKVAGISMIESEKIREDLATTGVYVASPVGSTTIILLCNHKEFRMGKRTNLEILVLRKPEFDTVWIIGRGRCDFEPIHSASTYKLVSMGYNIS